MSTKKLQIIGSLGSNIAIDPTLEQSGKAADAKVVGDKIAELENIVLPNATAINMERDDSTITITIARDDNSVSESVITLHKQ